MIYLVKKVSCHNSKEFVVYSASGHIITMDGEEKHYLQEEYKAGTISVNEFKGVALHGGTISVDTSESKVTFDITMIENDDGRQRRAGLGKFFGASGQLRYVIEEKFQTKKAFWIFRSGYPYYTMTDVVNDQQYKVMDITFASDMHYYYVFGAEEQLLAAIHKPYRNVGEDEYHVYANKKSLQEGLLFIVAYMDFFHYPYNSAMAIDHENYKRYEDDAAYSISEEELLQLYDESFVRRVILDEA